MDSQIKLKQPKLTTAELNDLIIDSIQDIKGQKIVRLDLRNIEEAPTDFFIICEGESNTQVKAISDRIQQRVKQEGGQLPSHVEGERNAVWICVDYFTTVVHIFHRDARAFYELEELWSDAEFTEYKSL